MKSVGAVVCAAAVWMAADAAWAQEDEWIRLMREGDAQESAGNYAAASAVFREALKVASPSTDERYPLALNALANTYALLGKYADAERSYRKALVLMEGVEGKQSADYALIEANLALHFAEHGQMNKTEPMLRDAIAIYGATVATDDQRLALARSCLAGIMLEKKHYDEAERLLNLARESFRKNPETGKAREAVAANNLGVVRRFQGRIEEAIPLFEESIAITSQRLGPEHPLLLRSLNNLASAYEMAGRRDEATPVYERALAIATKRLGKQHPEYAALLLNYAELQRRLGHKGEAKKLAAEARAVLRDNQRANGAGMTVDVSAFQPRR